MIENRESQTRIFCGERRGYAENGVAMRFRACFYREFLPPPAPVQDASPNDLHDCQPHEDSVASFVVALHSAVVSQNDGLTWRC
jgi:hypothetical protein